MWPFNWKLSACTFTWCYLFFKILQNEICKFGRNLPLATFGSERVKWLCQTAACEGEARYVLKAVYQKQNWVEKARNASLPKYLITSRVVPSCSQTGWHIFVGRVRGHFYSFKILQVVIPTNFGEMQETSYRLTLIKREILYCLRIESRHKICGGCMHQEKIASIQ